MRHWFLIWFLSVVPLCGSSLDLSVGAEGAILINASTGVILYEKSAYEPIFPASTTKIATALYALKTWDFDVEHLMTANQESIASITPQAKKQSNYRSPPYWLETDGTHISIKKGETLRFCDLLYAMLLQSANDASNVIAQNVGGTIPKFMQGLNAYLKELGCQKTFFNNPHGLHHPAHVTTPFDLALIAKEALKDPYFCQIVSTVRYSAPQTNLEYERIFVQTNSLLKKGTHFYDKAIGIKTGTTQAAGKNLVAAAQKGDRTLIAVAMGYRGSRSELYQDVIKMFETAFSEPKMRRMLLDQGEQTLTTSISGTRSKLKTYLPDGLYYDFYPSEENEVKASIVWKIPPLPILPHDQVGVIQLKNQEGLVLQEMPILAVAELKPTLWSQLKQFLHAHKRGRKLLFLFGASSVMLFLWKMRRTKCKP